MSAIYYTVFSTAAGKMTLTEERSVLIFADFGVHCRRSDAEERATPFLRKVEKQLKEYFDGKRQIFDIPVILNGTPFQTAVWNVLRKIPFGKTRSYKDVAVRLGNPQSCRAVGSAIHRNPVSIIVPCHRVIGSDGSLTGYAGGLDVKRFLLEHERTQQKKAAQ
ncbi:MAG: methylated-DNA--[protein]-cysteine S-methyltransferase [Planctomycetaceae bacterium]|jgi:methylated-DNA-[protein]-cysteine S-methyltransferase|nr:methylated-DNA--[protein]-cysteine S-methyltransferase [Planctomycetaceae bacterium]